MWIHLLPAWTRSPVAVSSITQQRLPRPPISGPRSCAGWARAGKAPQEAAAARAARGRSPDSRDPEPCRAARTCPQAREGDGVPRVHFDSRDKAASAAEMPPGWGAGKRRVSPGPPGHGAGSRAHGGGFWALTGLPQGDSSQAHHTPTPGPVVPGHAPPPWRAAAQGCQHRWL